MRPIKDITGLKFGQLTAVRLLPGALWLCQCDCGGTKQVRGSSLRSGTVKSCGCAYRGPREGAVHRNPLYSTWRAIKRRCTNENDPSYKNYGGRGITMYPAWVDSGTPFVLWVEAELGPRPAGMSLDRIDNDGNYEPGNLKWSTRSEQSFNQRPKVHNADYDAVVAERDLWRERAVTLGWVD